MPTAPAPGRGDESSRVEARGGAGDALDCTVICIFMRYCRCASSCADVSLMKRIMAPISTPAVAAWCSERCSAACALYSVVWSFS